MSDDLSRKLSESLLSVSRVSPRLQRSPGVLFGAAHGGDPISDAEAVAGFSEGKWLHSRLMQMDPEDQVRAFERLSEAQKALVRKSGYVGVSSKEQAEAVSKSRFGFFGKALRALGAPLRAVQQGYRAAKLIDIEGTAWWSAREWARQWRRAGDDVPDFFIPPEKTLRERNVPFSEQDLPIIVDVVGEMDEFDLYAKYGVERVQEVFESKDFERAVAELKATRISFGRVVAHSLGIRPGQKFQLGPLKTNADLFDLYSGLGDGLMSWFGDPLNKPLQAAGPLSKSEKTFGGAYRAAKYGLHSAEDIRRVSQFPAVQRAYSRIATHFAQGRGAAEVVSEFPSLAPLARDLQKVKPSSGPEVQEFLEGEAGFLSILQGRASKFYGVDLQAVRATPLKGVKEAAKRGVTAAFESTESVPGLRRVGIGFRRFVNLVPKKPFIVAANANDTENVEVVRQLAKFALPQRKVDEAVNAWLAADDVAGKRTVLTGLIDNVFERLGASDNIRLDRYRKKLLGGMLEEGTSRSYGYDELGNSVSALEREGAKPIHAALFEHQQSVTWALPEYRELVRAMRSERWWRQLPGMGHLPDTAIDAFMDRVWKPIVLFRLAFPLRASGEETARLILEDGFLPAFRSRMAASAVANWEKSLRKPLLSAKQLKGPRGFGPSELNIVKWLGQRVHASLAQVEGALAGDKYLNAVLKLYERFGVSLLPKGISALGDAGGTWTDRPESIVRYLKDSESGVLRRVRLRPGRAFKGYRPDDDLFPWMWAQELGRHMESESFRIAIQHLDDPAAARSALVEHLRESPMVKKAYRAKHSSKGGVVGETITVDDALVDWADQIVAASRGLTFSSDGQPIVEVLDLLRSGRKPSIDDLARVKNRPVVVQGQEMLPVFASWWDGLTNAGFGWLERKINWLSRQPIFIHEYAKALDESAKVTAQLKSLGVRAAEHRADEIAMQVAADRTIKLIDNKELRSQFALANKNLFPFWHAQEQFLKRWAKAIVRDPSILRRHQLIMNGLRHSGQVVLDEQGDDVFRFPASMFMMNIVQRAAPLFGGKPLGVAVPIGMTGKVKFMQAGMESPRAALFPQMGPIGSLAIGLAKKYFPEYAATSEEIATGDHDRRPLWEQVMPSTVVGVYKLFEAAFDEDERNSRMASWQISAMQYLEATGHGLPEDATEGEREEFQDRVRHWAMSLGALQLILGFAGPVKPQPQFLENLTPEFRNFLNSYDDYGEAVAAFVEKYPDATPYTVFGSKVTARGARLQATDAVADFLANHQGFVDKYGSAASWWLPQEPGKFSLDAWNRELANELRIRKTPKEFWEDVKIRVASNIYYPERDDMQKALDAARSPAQKERIRAQWDAWQTQFLEMHPIFRAHLSQGGFREVERQQQLFAIREMLEDPDRPKNPSESAIRSLLDNYEDFLFSLSRLGRTDLDEKRRKRMRSQFRAYGFGLEDASARQMFVSLISPSFLGED